VFLLLSRIARNFSFRSSNGSCTDILIIQIEQIERVENWTTTTEKRLVENATTLGVQANQLAVNHCVFYFELDEIAFEGLENFCMNAACARPIRTSPPRRAPML
jgi:hypothetical protein